MHEAHKRVHDPQLVKHLPGRNHKANMVDGHLEGCCRERCGVGSETLLFMKWNTLTVFQNLFGQKYFSETDLSCPGVGCLLMTYCHTAWHYHQLLNGVDPQGSHAS